MQEVLNWMGYGLCHQLPERSFFGGGVQVPVCARDTGIYVGFVLSLVVLRLLHGRSRPTGFAPGPAWLLMGLLLAAMGWDGVTSYAGLRETTNDLRLITGLGVGFSAAALVYPMLQDELWRHSSPDRVLSPYWRLAVWCASILLSFIAIRYLAGFLGIAYPVAVALSIMCTLAAINLVMVGMLPAFDRKGENITDLVVPFLIALAFAVIEVVLAGYLRVFLDGLAR